jgi:SAM-dependent methyltransferase
VTRQEQKPSDAASIPGQAPSGGARAPVSTTPDSGDDVIDVEYEVLREAVRPAHGSGILRATHKKTATADGDSGKLSGAQARDALAGWGHAHGRSPAPRHRRRLMLKWVRTLQFANCLDAGCGDGELLRDVICQGRSLGRVIAGFGCDASLDDALLAPNDPMRCTYLKLDPMREPWPNDRQFDLVICSELLGQAPHWRAAMANLVQMTRRYLLLTVPAGPMRMADRVAGHRQHFDGLDLAGAVVGHGLTLLSQRRWGFPVHSLFQTTADRLPVGPAADAGAGQRPSSLPSRLIAEGLYLAFFSNDLFHGGAQQILLAERRGM